MQRSQRERESSDWRASSGGENLMKEDRRAMKARVIEETGKP